MALDLIKALKKNDKPFGLMSEEMQAKAKEIGTVKEFLFLTGYTANDWALCAKEQSDFSWHLTYRLRSDYEESKPEIVECKVKVCGEATLGYCTDGGVFELHIAPNRPDFIGFKYEKGKISTSPRMYFYKISNALMAHADIEDTDYEVLTPTAVLFRSTK